MKLEYIGYVVYNKTQDYFIGMGNDGISYHCGATTSNKEVKPKVYLTKNNAQIALNKDRRHLRENNEYQILTTTVTYEFK